MARATHPGLARLYAAGWTQERVAQALGVSTSTVRRWDRVGRMRVDDALALARLIVDGGEGLSDA